MIPILWGSSRCTQVVKKWKLKEKDEIRLKWDDQIFGLIFTVVDKSQGEAQSNFRFTNLATSSSQICCSTEQNSNQQSLVSVVLFRNELCSQTETGLYYILL